MINVNVTQQVIDVTVTPGSPVLVDVMTSQIAVVVTTPTPVAVDVMAAPVIDVDVTAPTPIAVTAGTPTVGASANQRRLMRFLPTI